MPGCSLLSYITHHGEFPMDEIRVRIIILEIAQGLQDLHQRNIVHRDIKLANILMSDKSPGAKAHIADFGCAAKLGSATDTLTWRIGTEGYTAPEIVKGKPYSFSVDIYSLGCLMH